MGSQPLCNGAPGLCNELLCELLLFRAPTLLPTLLPGLPHLLSSLSLLQFELVVIVSNLINQIIYLFH